MSSDPRLAGTVAAEPAFTFEQLPGADRAGGPATRAELLADAWSQAEQIRQSARVEGEQQGYADGLANAEAVVKQALQTLSSAVEGLEQARGELLDQLERDAVDFGFQLAERILSGVVAVERERVIDVSRNALRRLNDRHRVTLIVNPEELELVSSAVHAMRAELGGIEHCDVQSDRRVGRGGAIVRTDEGEIDASVEAQLDHAREIVVAALGSDA